MTGSGHEDGIVTVVLGHSDLQPLVVLGLVCHGQGVGDLTAADGILAGDIAVLAGLQHQRNVPNGGMEQGHHNTVALTAGLGAIQSAQNTGSQIDAHLMIAEAGDGQHGDGLLVKQGAQHAAACEEGSVVEAGQILVGALLAVAGDETVHQSGVLLMEGLVVEAGLLQGVLTPVGDKDIRLGDQLLQSLTACRSLGVQCDALLVGVFQGVGGVLAVVLRTALVDSGETQGIAAGGLHLNDLSTEVCQIAGAAGSSDEGSQFNDLDTFQGALDLAHSLVSS